jgi:hypothetical protein
MRLRVSWPRLQGNGSVVQVHGELISACLRFDKWEALVIEDGDRYPVSLDVFKDGMQVDQ